MSVSNAADLATGETMLVSREQYDALQAHARANYETGGWDFVVECFDHPEAQAVADREGCTCYDDLVQAVGKLAALWREHEEELSAGYGG